MTVDVHTLCGPYAVNALPPDERAVFEQHLTQCESCAQEARELRETAARLASGVAAAPPAELKQRVLAEIARTRPLPPSTRAGGERGPRRWLRRSLALAASVLLVVSVALGATLAHVRGQLDQANAGNARITAVLSAPDATAVPVHAGAISGTVVVSRERGEIVFTAAGMPALHGAQVYQLWFMGGGLPRSAGLLGSADPGRPVLAAGLGGANQVGVTVEPAGGSPEPTTAPVMVVPLPV